MENLILQSLIISGVFYLLYVLIFSRTSFYKLNRMVLLSIPLVSVAVPLLAPLFGRPEALAALPVVQLPELDLTATATETNPSANWLLYLYMAGALVMLAAFVLGLFRCYRLISKARYLYENIYSSQKASGPFAFIDKIVIPEKLLESDKLEDIINHEKAHVEQGHSYDKLFYNLYTILFWFNPFAHLLSRELLTLHECLADEKALQNSSKENYARLLLSSAMGSEINLTGATPFFNSSLIKARITMIYKAKTNTKVKGLYLALLPMLAVMMIVSCQKTEEAETTIPPVEEKSEVMGLAEADQPPLFKDCDANASVAEQKDCFTRVIMTHVQKNFQYPEKARKEEMEGKIYVKFIITQSGEIDVVEVVRGLSGKTDQEMEAAKEANKAAADLVQSLPKMTPALKDGKAVPVSFVLPINMKLS